MEQQGLLLLLTLHGQQLSLLHLAQQLLLLLQLGLLVEVKGRQLPLLVLKLLAFQHSLLQQPERVRQGDRSF